MTKILKKHHSPPSAAPEATGEEGPEKEKPNENPENKQHKEDFERFLDDAAQGGKQRRSLKQIHADLVQLGFTGSYGRVVALTQGWRQTQHEASQTVGEVAPQI